MITFMIGTLTLGKFGYFMFWAFWGQVAMFAFQQKKYWERHKSEEGVSIKIMIYDNRYRIIISFMIALILSPVAVLTIMGAPGGPSEMAAIGAGACIDKFCEAYTNKKK